MNFCNNILYVQTVPISYTAWINYISLFALFRVGQQGIAACWQTRDIYAPTHSQNSLIKINIWGPSPWEQQGNITPGGLCSVTFSHPFPFNWQCSWKKGNLILMSWTNYYYMWKLRFLKRNYMVKLTFFSQLSICSSPSNKVVDSFHVEYKLCFRIFRLKTFITSILQGLPNLARRWLWNIWQGWEAAASQHKLLWPSLCR